ncbi:MAG: hypothetical protein WA885_25440 [Phormidesmis sp.]
MLKKLLVKIFAYLNKASAKDRTVAEAPDSIKNTTKNGAKQPSTGLSANLQTEIRAERKFSLAEAIGREGGSFMKGESTIPRPLRAVTEINQFITNHLSNPTSALSTTLQAWASSDIRVSRQLDTPLIALAQIIESIITQPSILYEFARQVAIAHSKLTGDRPCFQPPGQCPHPEATYSHESIQLELASLLQELQQKLTA